MSRQDTEKQEIIEQICDEYCKWPYFYRSRYKDPDEAHDNMVADMCEDCPLNKL